MLKIFVSARAPPELNTIKFDVFWVIMVFHRPMSTKNQKENQGTKRYLAVLMNLGTNTQGFIYFLIKFINFIKGLTNISQNRS